MASMETEKPSGDEQSPPTRVQQSVRSVRRKPWKQLTAKLSRWLHIYVSMGSCAIVLFFSVTGVTLNHPSWFGGTQEHLRESKGSLPADWLGSDVSDSSKIIGRLEVVEHLRRRDHVRGEMKSMTVDESQCTVAFRAPGYSADAFIDRATGEYDVVESSFGWVAVINDLHKGRDSGAAWSLMIDLSAVLLVFVSATGMILVFYINRHRRAGLVTCAVGGAGAFVIYWLFVPR